MFKTNIQQFVFLTLFISNNFLTEVKLKNYGLEQIEVIDNGCGVEEANFQALSLFY